MARAEFGRLAAAGKIEFKALGPFLPERGRWTDRSSAS
jgi:hypothetical protein